MSTVNYTKDNKGLQKMWDLITTPKIVMMATRLDKIPFSICPMTLQEMDEQGDLWFISSKESDHFKDIDTDNRVQLIYTDEPNSTYISMYGNATHIVNENKISELWHDGLNNWFKGKDDPNLVLLNVNMESAFYWERTTDSLVSFFANTTPSDGKESSETGHKGYVNMQNH